MPVPPKRNSPRDEDRVKQRAHGAQSDQGGNPYRGGADAVRPEPDVYEGPEESNQQRREE